MSDYERSKFGPPAENGVDLSPSEQQRLVDTVEDLARKNGRLVRSFNEKLNPKARRRRLLMRASIGAATLIAGVFLYNELTAAPTADLIAEAKMKVLGDADLLKQLGVCSVELQAQADIERYKAGHDMPSNDGFVARNYDDAALLAKKADVPCDPPSGDNAEYVTRFNARTVVLRPWQITDYNVKDACEALKRDLYQPQEMINPDLATPDIANQQALLLFSGTTCPEAGTYGTPTGK